MVDRELMSIEEHKENLNLGELGDRFEEYDSGNIADVISEIADEAIDTYMPDLYQFLSAEPEWCEAALSEFGFEGCGGTLDGIATNGEFMKYTHDLYEHLEDSLVNYALTKLEENGISEVDTDFVTEVRNAGFDNNSNLERIADFVNNYIEEHDLSPAVDDITEDAEERSENQDEKTTDKARDDGER